MPAVPLIRAKLRLPFIRPNRVPRPWLQARIAAGIRGPLTLSTGQFSLSPGTFLGWLPCTNRP